MNTARQSRVAVVRLVLCLAVASFAAAASAAPLGDLKVGSAGTMTISQTSLAFDPDPSSTPSGPPWNAEVATGTSLTFAGCASGVLGSPGCLAVTEAIQIFSPVTPSTVLPVTSYLTFAAHPLLVYSLVSLGPGVSNTNCAGAVSIGDTCSAFAGYPVLLTRSASGTTLTLAVSGKASDTGTGGLASGTTYQGAFVGPVVGQTPQQIQAAILSGGSVTTSQSADFWIVPGSPVELIRFTAE